MEVLVTGGCGFIGGHTVDALVDLGHRVTVVDDLSAPENDYFHFNDNAEYYRFDISTEGYKLSQLGQFDVIYHLAARSRIQPTFNNRSGATQVNTIGTQNVLDHALKSKDCRFIYAGTSSLYGHDNPIPFKEDMEPQLNTPYSLSKWFGERLCEFYSRTYGLQTIVLRYFNVYGPREPTKGHYAPVIGLFKRQFSAGERMTIVGSGNQRRDFTYINDVTAANIACSLPNCFPNMGRPGIGTSQGCFEIYNVGTGKNYSIKQVAQMVAGKEDISNVSVHVPLRKSELLETQADIRKFELAAFAAGWKPKYDLKDVINLY